MRKRIAAAISGAALIATGLAASPASAVETQYEHVVMHNNLCWDVPNSNAYAGAQVQQYGCNGTAAQKWSWRQVDATHYEVRTALNPGLCLNNWEGGDKVGNHIKLYPCDASNADRLVNFVRTGSHGQVQPKSAWKTCISGWGGNNWGDELRLNTCMDVANQNIGEWG
ncbi:RICIN domain-containing protein [Streptomyces vinaceus]|uniref:RICIN domain-containing protein n=1 Tax=Streptomyces vinaceus TaxID=1960 RepID=UPI0036AF3E54